jgi:hypothetical protein
MLTELTAQCNKIKELPVSGLGRLVNLHTLYLNSNMLPMGEDFRVWGLGFMPLCQQQHAADGRGF